ncbi:MAG: cytochrome bc complex cytochrome b subunit [Chloroflexota bacterium]|jgi:ubiquinol-cytochrome c reductase cytochrome b subunit|nr:cytochrome bc complex cytochrome b subunit [Chloroflexota bacterium]MDH5243239.1 cytochrome bc complex cytochrome b subunit [Chloroflexota bacterium]
MTTDNPPTSPGSVDDWFESRLHWRALMDALLHVRVPLEAKTFFFGGMTLFLFGVQVVTGTLLALYYKPTPEAAYDSVLFITSDVSFGWLIRSVHHWSANLMILFLVFHLLRVFFQAAYKYPRELTWVVGIGLLGLTMMFGFTGYLLPWDQRAYWATVVGTEIAGGIPFIGDALLVLLRGGADVTEATLSRFFGIHVLVLPLALGAVVAIHLVFVHQQGLANPTKPDPRPPAVPQGRTKPFFPHYILEEVIAWLFLLAMLVVLSSLFPAGLEEEANPLETPAHVKPEWYFLGVYELLKHIPWKVVGILTPMVFIVLLAVLPFIDRNPEVRPRKRPLAIALGILTIAVLIGLTIWGYYS